MSGRPSDGPAIFMSGEPGGGRPPRRGRQIFQRRKRPGGILVVPYGTGIGDLVNTGPLLEAIAAAHPGHRVHLLCDPSLAWMLPEGITAVGSVHGVRPWRRMAGERLPGRALSHLSVPLAGRLLTPLVAPRTARWMTGYLTRQEFPVVINLLEMLTGLGATGSRWTRGPWQPDRRHVVDLIAGELEARGIPVPSGRRAPRLQVTPVS
ncbi:MAG: hypothetical protein ABR564_01215, partial [Candidatus Dormibacteria bacterium]